MGNLDYVFALPGEYWTIVHPPAPNPNNGAAITMLVTEKQEQFLLGDLANGNPDIWELGTIDFIRRATEDEILDFQCRATATRLRKYVAPEKP